MLTKSQAEKLVLARLKSLFESAQLSIADTASLERSFGWVFLVRVDNAAANTVGTAKIPSAVIVNKYSEQIIASSIDHAPERLIQLYEKLLAKNEARAGSWCLTVSSPWPWGLWKKRSIAERANDGGFYQIGGKEIVP